MKVKIKANESGYPCLKKGTNSGNIYLMDKPDGGTVLYAGSAHYSVGEYIGGIGDSVLTPFYGDQIELVPEQRKIDQYNPPEGYELITKADKQMFVKGDGVDIIYWSSAENKWMDGTLDGFFFDDSFYAKPIGAVLKKRTYRVGDRFDVYNDDGSYFQLMIIYDTLSAKLSLVVTQWVDDPSVVGRLWDGSWADGAFDCDVTMEQMKQMGFPYHYKFTLV